MLSRCEAIRQHNCEWIHNNACHCCLVTWNYRMVSLKNTLTKQFLRSFASIKQKQPGHLRSACHRFCHQNVYQLFTSRLISRYQQFAEVKVILYADGRPDERLYHDYWPYVVQDLADVSSAMRTQLGRVLRSSKNRNYSFRSGVNRKQDS